LVARLRTAVVAACIAAFMLAAPSAHATFPGANGKIAFVRDGDIWAMNPDGSNGVDLTNTPSTAENSPAWSADGAQIAYVRATTRRGYYGEPYTDIWIMNADGSGQRQVVPAPYDPNVCGAGALLFAHQLGAPAWSPDGSKLVFANFRRCWYDTEYSDTDLYTVNPDGTGQALLTLNGSAPRWSPDGTKIGYTAVCGGGGCGNVEWIASDGSSRFNVWDSGVSADYFYDWSPDGGLMSGCGEGRLLPQGSGCYTVSPDGNLKTDLSRNVSPVAWSPDGTKFVWGYYDIYTGNVDGTGVIKLAPGSAPDWQPVNRPPDCSNVTATPSTLWPPNNRLVPVSLSGATDPDGDQVTLTITGVTQDEPTRHIPDAKLGPAGNQVAVRAKRSNHGDGRVYRIAFKATDARGGECSGTATVGVPRRKNRLAVDSAPPTYDSLVGTPGGGGQDGDQHGKRG
jgi:Tol biopolymer transport system component